MKYSFTNFNYFNTPACIFTLKILSSTEYLMNVQNLLINSNTKCILKAGEHCVSNVTLHETNFQHIPRGQFSVITKVI